MKNKWTPIEKGNPKKEKEYLCQVSISKNTPLSLMEIYEWKNGNFLALDDARFLEPQDDIEAWRDLPEKYIKGE